MAWNEPGNNGQRDPWNRNRPGGKSPLDDLLNNARKRLGKMGQGPGSLLTGVLVLLIVGLLFSSYTIIGARQAGVVLRFGEYSRTLPPGFHLKLPQPIESVTKVEATRIRSVTDKVAMLTKDENIITIDFTVQYQVDDSRKYLFSLNDPDGTIGAAAEAAVRSVIGSSDMDQILSAAGASLVTQAQETLQKTLDTYDSGLRVTEVSFQNVAPPNEVKDAFDDVNNAREDKQSIENAALAYASKVVPVARGDAARIAAEAAGYKAERVARATGDAARFDLLLKQYKAAPEVTRKRLWLETMEQVMAKNPKVIDGSNGRNIISLPTLQGSPAAQPEAGAVGTVVSPPTGNAAGKGTQP
ncbi:MULTISPECIES: FtsH protease activity modulator HflK [Rhodanobacter]|uniref:FtsH protease activity modulator HflK n=1 Tax=Rhodanobacter TaxID=75309 RepID=UPI000260D948|nr:MULTISPECIES: FtsH protease activity modulator HflK [Rhodanobacter]EIM03368.1 integral membrane protease subunit [Rhodanobacter denitrificans]KZC18801.1 protease modulator HflK [Rhodanobacter denitrificans]UJJ52585.1 FtsH protease activity modulator HflK [Rhodanobacter denitrificans]UJM89088.1 FtsH protease activity modulator HflK [Rhodanobacter denitrificans]UJM95339.1 FtsH protease activity modulator HflK [Rhodanobacter denitrificans]